MLEQNSPAAQNVATYSSSIQVGNTPATKTPKDSQSQSPAVTSPLQTYNFSSHNLNICVQQYDEKVEEQVGGQHQGEVAEQLSQILEDQSENTPHSFSSGHSKLPSNLTSGLSGYQEQIELYDQQEGAMKRGKMFAQDMRNFGVKSHNEQDESIPLTEENQDIEIHGAGEVKKGESLKVSAIKHHRTLLSKTQRTHVVTIRSPDVIWRQKFFYIAGAVLRLARKMKQINIFHHPEQLYHTQLNAINDLASPDLYDPAWGQIMPRKDQYLLKKSMFKKSMRLKIGLLRRSFRIRFRPFIRYFNTTHKKFSRTLQTLSRSIPVFNSMSLITLLWSYFIYILSFALFILISFAYSFGIDHFNILSDILQIALPIVFFCNVLVNANTTFFQRGNQINNHWSIFLNYAQKGLLIDGISTVALMFPVDSLPVFLFFLRGFLYQKFFTKQAERFLLLQKRILACTQMLSILFLTLLAAHFSACLYYIVGNREQGWLTSAEFGHIKAETLLDQYLFTLTAVLSHLTFLTSYDRDLLTANTRSEKIFLVFLAMLGMFIVAFLVHGVQKILKEGDVREEEYQQELRKLSVYMSSHDVEPVLRERSRKYLEFMYSEEQERAWSTQNSLRVLSTYLREEIIKDVFAKSLRKVSLLGNLFTKNPQFLEKLALRSEELSLGPEEILVRQGSKTMPYLYFVTHGEVQLFVEMGSKVNTQEKVFKTLRTSECFNSYEFFTGNFTAQLSAKSIGVSRLLRVSLDDMQELLREFPREREAYCFLKDSVILKQDLSSINLPCYSCKQTSHYVLECPYLFYGTQPQKVLKEMNKQIKHIIKTFKRSLKRKKLSAVGKYEFINRKAVTWQENYFKEIAEFNDEFGIDFDEEDDDDGDEDKFSSDTSIRLPGESSQSMHDFETLTMNQSRFDRKSILRVHSGSSKFTARQRHKDSESQKSLINSRIDQSSREERARPQSISISKFGRMIKLSDLNVGPSEDSAFSSNKEHRISLSNNYEVNTLGRFNSGEFFGNDEGRRMMSFTRKSDSDRHLSYENILERSQDELDYGDISEAASQRRSNKRHSTHQTNRTNRTNKTSKTTITKTLQQLELDARSLHKSNTVEPDRIDKRFALADNISPIHYPRKESGNSSSSMMALQLFNSSNNNVNNYNSNNPGSSQINANNNNNNNLNNQTSSFLNNANASSQPPSGTPVNAGNSNNNSNNVPQTNPNPGTIGGNQNQPLSLAKQTNSLVQKQGSGSASNSQQKIIPLTASQSAQIADHRAINSRRSQIMGGDAFVASSWSLGTVKSFELYFPQNNVENIIEHYNKLQRKRISRRAKKKRTTKKTTQIKQINPLQPQQQTQQQHQEQQSQSYQFEKQESQKQVLPQSHIQQPQTQQEQPKLIQSEAQGKSMQIATGNFEEVDTKGVSVVAITQIRNQAVPSISKIQARKDNFSQGQFNLNDSPTKISTIFNKAKIT